MADSDIGDFEIGVSAIEIDPIYIVGSTENIAARLFNLLPPSWFPNPAPNVSTVLQGFANVGAFAYGLISFAKLQTRISTASGFFLDLVAVDYFGRFIRRRVAEADSTFMARIKKELVRERVTRKGMIQALTDLTGKAPIVFEPWNTSDAGGYGTHCGYGVAGGWGSTLLPAQVFLTVYRPGLQGVPGVDGYGGGLGGYGVGAIEYVGPSMIAGTVTDSDVYATIEATKPSGVICWTKLV
jgi:hypothetical protein